MRTEKQENAQIIGGNGDWPDVEISIKYLIKMANLLFIIKVLDKENGLSTKVSAL